MRIAVVNDVSTITYTLGKILKSYDNLEVAWTAANGSEAVEKSRADTPDLILMDLIMPVMNGVEATRNIMQQSPCAILIVTSSVVQNASMVFEAMGAGALDAVNTPDITTDSERAISILINKIDSQTGRYPAHCHRLIHRRTGSACQDPLQFPEGYTRRNGHYSAC